MKTIVIFHSYHHNNTLKVAEAIGNVLKAEVKMATLVGSDVTNGYDLVGLGAGIDSGMHYPELLEFAQALPVNRSNQKFFIFSTSAVQGKRKVFGDHSKLREILHLKKYEVVGEFSCKGYNTNSILKHIGGMNNNRPNDDDMNHAREFASSLC